MIKDILAGVAACFLALSSLIGPALPAADSDGAGVWTQLGPDGGDIQGLARNPKSSSELYAATHSGFVYRSTNGGSIWTRLSYPFGRESRFDPDLILPGPGRKGDNRNQRQRQGVPDY